MGVQASGKVPNACFNLTGGGSAAQSTTADQATGHISNRTYDSHHMPIAPHYPHHPPTLAQPTHVPNPPHFSGMATTRPPARPPMAALGLHELAAQADSRGQQCYR